METEEDWLLRPVLEGKCLYESLKNGTLDLLDIARLNDALDVQEENDRRQRSVDHGVR